MKFRLAIYTLSVAVCVFPAAAQRTVGDRRLLESNRDWLAAEAVFDTFEAAIPTRDEKELAADVYVPRGGGAFPVILIQTPYNKNGVRPWFQGEGRWGPSSLFTNRSYAFVVVDRRGRFGSQAALPPRGNAELTLATDGYDTVEWIADQAWSNGKVGTWGPSALGRAQFETARTHPPNLACSVPVVAPLYIGYDTYFPGGVLWQEFVDRLGVLGWNVKDTLTRQPTKAGTWITHEESRRPSPDEFQVPMLWIAGWYDIYINDMISDFLSLRTAGDPKWRNRHYLLIGPWTHFTADPTVGALSFPAAHLYDMKQAEAFLDHCLRGVDNRYSNRGPAIEYFSMNDAQWRTAMTWPPRGTEETSYALARTEATGLSLLPRGPQDGMPQSEITFDPSNPVPTVGGHVLFRELKPGPQDQRRRVESREDTLEFDSAVLTQSLTLAGAPRVELFVSTDGPDTDFTAILTQVYPDGRSMLIGEGVRRLRFRTTTAHETPATPGEVYPLSLSLPHTAITLKPGHKLRLVLSSSSFPRFAVNNNDGGPMYQGGKGRVARNVIYHSAKHPSALVLPLMSATESD